MNLPPTLTFCGRTFSRVELQLIAELVVVSSGLSITEISRALCQRLDWRRPSGRLKNHEGRQLLERLAQQGRLQLPAPRPLGGRGPRRVRPSPASDPQPEVTGTAGAFAPLQLDLVPPGRTGPSRLWREWVERYHYLGWRVPFGANLRYFVRSAHAPHPVLACLLWSSAAWKIAVRDRWIGWEDQRRAQNLPWVINNSRFLILPWVHVKGLASKILAQAARQVPEDWEVRYGCRPLLLETFVDAARFRGTCYRAANWIALGPTTGRGRMDRTHAAHGRAVKQVYVYPLVRHAPAQLCRPRTPPPAPPPPDTVGGRRS